MIKSQKTLHAKSQDNNDVEKAVEILKNMNHQQKVRHLNFLQNMFVAKNAPKKVREDFALEVFDEELSDNLDATGLTEEVKQKFADLFFEAVSARLLEDDNSFKQSIRALLNEYSPSP